MIFNHLFCLSTLTASMHYETTPCVNASIAKASQRLNPLLKSVFSIASCPVSRHPTCAAHCTAMSWTSKMVRQTRPTYQYDDLHSRLFIASTHRPSWATVSLLAVQICRSGCLTDAPLFSWRWSPIEVLVVMARLFDELQVAVARCLMSCASWRLTSRVLAHVLDLAA